jgi:hypothetical protein
VDNHQKREVDELVAESGICKTENGNALFEIEGRIFVPDSPSRLSSSDSGFNLSGSVAIWPD